MRHDPAAVATTLLIVDDHQPFRDFARELLDGAGFDVVDDAADGESALERVECLRPDVVLIDVGLPGIDGFEVAARLSRRDPRPLIVLTSSRGAGDFGDRLRCAPICGFIPKRRLSGDALTALISA